MTGTGTFLYFMVEGATTASFLASCAPNAPTQKGVSKASRRDRFQGGILLTSKKWRLQSGCNHSTAYVDQWKG